MPEKKECPRFLSFLYRNFFGKILRMIWPIRLLSKLFAIYTDSFLSKRKISSFIKKYSIDMSQFVIPDGGFESFNDFFIRKLRPGQREIDKDSNVIVSPADSKLLAISSINNTTKFFVKSKPFCLKTFFRDEDLAQKYQNGTLLLFRLAPRDYHRYHFPFDSIASEPRIIFGKLDSVNPIVYKSGFMPIQENDRDIIILKSNIFGDVLFAPVGAMFVGRITHTYVPDQNCKKGDEMGYFSFGGSSLVLLFEKDIISVDQKFLDNSEKNTETPVKMGERIGYLSF